MSKKTEFSALDLITTYTDRKKSPSSIEISLIFASPDNPRIFGREEVDDLCDSMKRLGLIEPILVRKEKSNYTIVAGERRYRAAKKLGWHEIPAIITDADLDTCYEMALAENEKRKNLNPWEVGRAIQFLRKEKKKTADEVAGLLGYTERYIKQLSSIARLDQKAVFEMIRLGQQPSVKNLESLLRKKEGRTQGETISPQKKKISIDITNLSPKQRDLFQKDLITLKKKYGI